MKVTDTQQSPGLIPDEYMPDYQGGPSGFDVAAIIAIIRRNLLLIIAIVAAATAVGLVATLLMTPRYTASASVQINQSVDQVLKSQDVQQMDAIQDADRFLQTQADILKSRDMTVRVAQRLGLFNGTSFFDQMNARPPENDGSSDNANKRREAVIGLIQSNLAITLPRNSRITTISFESPSPTLAKRVANTFADEFIKANLERRFESTGYARDFLSRQLADAKRKLEDSERALNDYARSAGLIRTTSPGDPSNGGASQGSTSITAASLVQLNSAANDARAARIAAEEKWRSIANVPLTSIPDVLSNQAYQALVAQKSKAEADLQAERARHLESHPSVVLLKAQVAEIDKQLNALARGIRDSIRNEFESARLRENQLVAEVAKYKSETLDDQDRSVRYNILAREADTNRTLYDGLLQRYKEISAASGITVNNISIVDQADTPIKPTSPKLFLNLALAILLGLAVAAGVVLLREQLDDVVRSPDDVENKLGLHLLGVIPDTGEMEIMEAIQDPRSSISESYNALRTSLIYSTATGLPQLIMFTSSQPGEGKSTSAYAIARSMANLGKRACLIEVDLRRPMLAKTMGIDMNASITGMVSLLTSDSDLQPSKLFVTEDRLTIIPAGAIPPGPTELLSSGRFMQIIEQLREQFDVVIMDGPPVLGLADAPILASIADATVYVVEAQRQHRGAAKTALRRLRAARGNLVGAVLTKFNPEKAGGSYRHYGYGYYMYGANQTE